jgi:predicted AlkP superfamily phosphohydrolase/phosphomutase
VPAGVVFIGLDAAEATLVDRWAAEGVLPTFARLRREGVEADLANCLETLPGGIWPEIVTGRSVGRLGQFFHPRQLHTGEARLRTLEPDEIDSSLFWWTWASDAGRRVAAVQQVQTVVRPGLNGIQLCEWGLHDRQFAIASDPPELLEELRARHGDHPVASCDAHGETTAGYEALLDGLVEGVRRTTGLLSDLLAREEWDAFAATFGETHCVGHQFWHFFDPGHPNHETAAPVRLRDAIRSVYAEVDAGVGRLVDEAGPDATVVVVASHGIGPYVGGYQLLPEVLVRLGYGSGSGAAAHVRTRLPRPVRTVLRTAAGPFRAKLQARAGSLDAPLESPGTRAVALPNNRCGAIRLNVRGREPYGAIEPGAEAQACLEELRRELLALEHAETGERIVVRVTTAEETFGPGHHPDVPDLLVVFRDDLGPLEACRSPRVGLVRRPNYNPRIPRSGDHTTHSRLWAVGPGIEPGRLAGGNALDVAPTLLDLLGVPLPDDLDGRPLLRTRARA